MWPFIRLLPFISFCFILFNLVFCLFQVFVFLVPGYGPIISSDLDGIMKIGGKLIGFVSLASFSCPSLMFDNG